MNTEETNNTIYLFIYSDIIYDKYDESVCLSRYVFSKCCEAT